MIRRWGTSLPSEFLLFVFLVFPCTAQIRSYPYSEGFDSVSTPSLPAGWNTSSNRLPSGDFFTTTTSPRSRPNALQSTNSTIGQFVVSPGFDFTSLVPSILEFFTSRSGTHISPVLVEASLDDGMTYPILLGDTLKNPGSTSYVRMTITLPETLANQSSVRIRWRVLGGIGGTSGTFRLDDVSLGVFTSFDLAIDTLVVTSSLPTSSELLSLSVNIVNRGKQSASGYSVGFFLDEDSDGVADPPEQFASAAGTTMNSGDSITVTATHPPLRSGDYRFIAAIDFPADEYSANDTAMTQVYVSVPRGAVVVNEIMYAPAGDEPEWVELFNASGDTVDLKGWKISDSNISSKSSLSSTSFRLSPKSYGIVAKDSMFTYLHPEVRVPVAVSSFSALNNTTADGVVVFDSKLNTADSVYYFPDWGGGNGISLERLDVDASSVRGSNWAASIDSLGSSPGRANSVVRLVDDLALQSVVAYGSTLTILVKNVGKNIVQSFSVEMSTGETPFASVSYSGSLNPDATAFLAYGWADPPAGETTVHLRIQYSPDQRSRNDTLSVTVRNKFEPKSVIINEIMYEPASGQNEWVEFYNRSETPVNIGGWRLSVGDVSSFLFPQGRIIEPHGYIVAAADSTILALIPQQSKSLILNKAGGLGLSNDGTTVVLRDLTQATIDSVSYRPSWHTPDVADTRGRSLERINPDYDSNDPRNWGTSAGSMGSTPGDRNTLFTSPVSSDAALSFEPNPFSPDGDGFEDVTVISYRLPAATSVIRVRIFDRIGRLIRTLADGAPASASGQIVWDGYDSERRRTRVGVYIVLLEAVDNRGGVVSAAKGVIVVATRL